MKSNNDVDLKGSPYWKGWALPRTRAARPTALVDEGIAEAFGKLIAASKKVEERRRKGDFWLARHVAGDVSEALSDAQRSLDRAVEGGFFDAYEGRPAVGESEIEVRRAILDEASALLDDPSVEVHLAVEEFTCPVEDRQKWRTRLVACPKKEP